ncbi:hypothetical protein BDA99DRAFT_569480 [Phascolomyces articulosus]|uniref:Uncharacterized protein n=1 Tax=Phascolomyces articulosus TaxID=60185 RepID=A0AAD5K6W8_9FUNG|nr:hypothetical protein BDA99DRAFT_569480 [Phascolomyces articulosus]
MYPHHLDRLQIPYDYRPGSDSMSKAFVKDARIMNSIVTTVVGAHAHNKYTTMDCEWIDGRGDALFAPMIERADLPPIVVEIQNTVNISFIRRIMNYCWNAQVKFNVKPIAITFCVKTIRSEIVDKFEDTDKEAFMKKLPCEFWARDYFMMTATTISNYVATTPMHPIVALEYVLTQQERCLISLGYKDDPTVKILYAIAKDSLKHNLGDEKATLAALIESCQQNQKQYKKSSML